MSLVNEQLKHEVYIQRFATELLNSNIYPSLKEAEKAIRAVLGEFETISNQKQLSDITKAILGIVDDTVAQGWSDATDKLNVFAVYEADYYAGLIGDANDIDLNVPAERSIASYMKSALMMLGEGERAKVGAWAYFVQQATDSLAEQYSNIIKAGYMQGATISQLKKSLRMFNEGLAKQQAEALARTGAQHYANSAREAMAQANADVIEKRYYLSVLDNRTTLGCRSLHGKTWPIDDDTYIRLPRHMNCLTEDTLVSTCSDVSNVYKRWYKGAMVKITTKSGRSIKITPNHPILTLRGWVGAGSVNSSDKVICVKDVAAFSANDYKNSVKTSFGNLFSSVNVAVDSGSIAVRPASTKDFHGDFTDSEVSIVNADSLGWGNIVESSFKNLKNFSFISGCSADFSLFGFSSCNSLINSCNSTFGGFVRGAGKVGNLLWRGLSHSCKLLFRPISSFSINGFKEIFNGSWAARKPNLSGDALYANSGLVSGDNARFLIVTEFDKSRVFNFNAGVFDNLVNVSDRNAESLSNIDWHNAAHSEIDDVASVEVFEFSGHVYNLENKDNWYLSNDIITHNCRSSYIYLLPGQDAPQGMMPAVGSGDKYDNKTWNATNADGEPIYKKPKYKGKRDIESGKFEVVQVPADTTADQWLKMQSRAFVEDSLGKTKAKLFLDGKLKLERMTDAYGEPLTLEELKAKHPAAFKKAGIED